MDINLVLKNAINAQKEGNFNDARNYYELFLKEEPNHATANHNYGLLLYNNAQREVSLRFLYQAIKLNPKITQFYISYIAALMSLNMHHDAKRQLIEAKNNGIWNDKLQNLYGQLQTINKNERLSSYKQPSEGQIKKLIHLMNVSKLEDALFEGKKLLENCPTSVFLLNFIGGIYAKLGNFHEAEVYFRKALHTTPEAPEILVNLGIALINLNNAAAAISYLKKALTLRPTFPIALNSIGQAYAFQKENTLAISYLEKAIAAKPEFSDAYFNLGNVLWSIKDYGGAKKAFESALVANSNYTPASVNLGLVLKDMGRKSDAVALYADILDREPENISILLPLGQIHIEQTQFEEAKIVYEKVIQLDPKLITAYTQLGFVYEKLREIDKAKHVYQRALVLDKQNYHAANNLGLIYLQNNQTAEAITSFTNAIEINKDVSYIYNNLANAFKANSEIDKAKENYQKAIKIDPTVEDYWLNYAFLLERGNLLIELECLIEEAENSLGNCSNAFSLIKANLLWRKKQVDAALKILTQIDLSNLNNKERRQLFSLQGKCFDFINDHKNAFNSFEQLNLHIKSSEEFSKFQPDAYYNRIIEQMGHLKNIRGHSQVANDDLVIGERPIFIIGFPRSGTTLLDTILRSHSSIAVLEEKPLVHRMRSFVIQSDANFLSLGNLNQSTKIEAAKVYYSQLKQFSAKESLANVTIDKLPLNIVDVPLISQIFPNALFVLALRHPMDSILSCWMQDFKLNHAMSNFVELERTTNLYSNVMETFDWCRKNLGLNVHEVYYEKIIDNMKDEITPLLRKFGLEWETQMDDHAATARGRQLINTPSYHQVVQPLYHDAKYRWQNYKQFLEPYIDVVKHWVIRFGYE